MLGLVWEKDIETTLMPERNEAKELLISVQIGFKRDVKRIGVNVDYVGQ